MSDVTVNGCSCKLCSVFWEGGVERDGVKVTDVSGFSPEELREYHLSAMDAFMCTASISLGLTDPTQVMEAVSSVLADMIGQDAALDAVITYMLSRDPLVVEGMLALTQVRESIRRILN